jgi:hypothetical protein
MRKMVTDLTQSLEPNEIQLLSKGPKFALTASIDEVEIRADFCDLANQLQWNQYRTDNFTTTAEVRRDEGLKLPRFPTMDTIYPPPFHNNELESKLKLCFAKINELIQGLKQQTPRNNLSKDEHKTLKTLKNKQLTYLPSDKGTEFCVIGNTAYDKAAMEHLSDQNIYCPIKRMTAKTIEKKVNEAWKEVCKATDIPAAIVKNYVTTNSDLPTFYHLIKTHKSGPTLKIRPIISNRKGPTHKLSWLFSRLLKPLLNLIPAHLENSLELLNDITSLPKENRKSINIPSA